MSHLQLVWPLYTPPDEGVRLSNKIDAVTLSALASLAETPSLTTFAADISSLSILHSGVGLSIGSPRFLAAALAFSDSYVMGIEDDAQKKPPDHESYAANVDMIAASLETDFPGVAQVRASPVIGRLSERINALIDEERARRLADRLSDIEFAERAGMPASPSSLQAIGSHPDERLGNKVFVATLRQTLGLSILLVVLNSQDCPSSTSMPHSMTKLSIK